MKNHIPMAYGVALAILVLSPMASASDRAYAKMMAVQSLTSKRNEAFDLMTNFIKKMADSRSSIIGNMR